MQGALHNHVHRVAGFPGDDALAERVGEARPHRGPGGVRRGVADAADRVDDGPVAGATTEISFQRVRQVLALRLGERSRRHDHAGGAEPALEGLRVDERLLDGMQRTVVRQTLDGDDRVVLGAEGGDQAGVHRLSVEPDRAGAAVPLVAALLDAQTAEVAQEGAQALAGRRLAADGSAVEREVHAAYSPRASSARISSAK